MLWPFTRLAWVVSLAFPLLSLAYDHQGKRHNVHRQGDLALRDQITCSGARFTFFADGLGACGQVSAPSDFIVALNTAQFTQSLCFQPISITINGVTQTATIVDSCPGCPPCGLDFSSGLFQAFGPLSLGVMTGDWSLGSGGGGSSPSSSSVAPPPPSTTSVETPTTSLLPSPTSTSQPSPTTASSTTSSTTTGASKSSTVPTQTTTNTVASPSGVIPGGTTGSSVLLDLESYLLLFAGVLESCSSSQ